MTALSAAGTVLAFNVMSPKFADLAPGLAYVLVLSNQTGADVTMGTYTVEGADASAGDPCAPGTWSPLKILPECAPQVAATTKKVKGVAIAAGGSGHVVGNNITLANGVVLRVLTVNAGAILTVAVVAPGSVASGSVPANPVPQVSSNGPGTGATFNLTWGDSDEASITFSAAMPLKAGSQCGIAVECPKQFVRIFSQGATALDLLAVVTRLRRTGM
jgi:hypothetical protein